MFAAIPYTTFPDIDLGPLTLRTFGLMVAIGVLVGAWVAASYIERFGISRDETYRTATWMVLAGIVGARLTWAATHPEEIENPVDVIAIWEGGIQFSGGFIAALIVGVPFFRRWTRLQRWRSLDGYALGLTIGLAIGRIGCYAVGEHFGRTSDFFLATRYEGGSVREPFLGDVRLVEGTTFHNTALYEFLFLLVLFAGLVGAMTVGRRRGRELAPGTLIGAFVLYYGVARFLTDTLRVNDERVLSMTGAQWLMLALIPAGIWILLKVRPRLAALAAAGPEAGEAAVTEEAIGAEEPATEEPVAAEPVAAEEPVSAGEPAAEEPATAEQATTAAGEPEVETTAAAAPAAAEGSTAGSAGAAERGSAVVAEPESGEAAGSAKTAEPEAAGAAERGSAVVAEPESGGAAGSAKSAEPEAETTAAAAPAAAEGSTAGSAGAAERGSAVVAEPESGEAAGSAKSAEPEARADAEPSVADDPAAVDEPKPEHPAAEESTTGSRTGGPDRP